MQLISSRFWLGFAIVVRGAAWEVAIYFFGDVISADVTEIGPAFLRVLAHRASTCHHVAATDFFAHLPTPRTFFEPFLLNSLLS